MPPEYGNGAGATVLEPGRPRAELVRGKLVRRGWALIAIGLLIPFLALWGATIGWHLRQVGVLRAGNALLIVGSLVFVARLLLWIGV